MNRHDSAVAAEVKAAGLVATASLHHHSPPAISPWLLRGFLAYAPGYVRRYLHSVRVCGAEHLLGASHTAAVIYMNHASWWDPMIAALLAGAYLNRRSHYTPIDAAALEKYKFFSRIGFFGIERNRMGGARKLLQIGTQILQREDSVLWITPQGKFADVRERPLRFESGLAHLLLHAPSCAVIPAAIEYVHWEERTPEALVLIAEPVKIDSTAAAGELNALLEARLTVAMDELAQASIRRDVPGFASLLQGKAGVGGFYDRWRSLKALARGERFSAQHGQNLENKLGH
jgi:1-acyl-sn-glycerol-3-phosphate acyltransferase